MRLCVKELLGRQAYSETDSEDYYDRGRRCDGS